MNNADQLEIHHPRQTSRTMGKGATHIGNRGAYSMSILARLNDVGILMGGDGRYVATLDQLRELVRIAKKSATCSVGQDASNGARLAYTYYMENVTCTQQQAADEVGVSQAALAKYIKRHRLPKRDGRQRVRGAP